MYPTDQTNLHNDFQFSPPTEQLDPKDERLIWQSQVIGELKAQRIAAEEKARRAESVNSEIEKENSNLRETCNTLREQLDITRAELHKAELKLSSKRSKK